jgi:hypothetical protein
VAGLRYSDRWKLAEDGTLGDLRHDRVPDELAQAMRVIAESGKRADVAFETRFNRDLMEQFGRGAQWMSFFSGGDDVDGFLDAVEILADHGRRGRFVSVPGRKGHTARSIPDVEERINRAFQRFRFGYMIEQGEVRRIGSPALDETIAGPALLAVQRPGWEEAERSFRESLRHQRGGETDDALTAAGAAVEAALKAAGMKGQTLKDLARSFTGSGLVPGYLSNVPELIEDLLDRLHAARSQAGDAQGKAAGADEVPQALADLAVYWAGAFVAYLAETISSAETR